MYNPCDAVTLPSGEKPEISVFTNDQQRALVQASYRHRYGVFIRLDLCTGLRMGELLFICPVKGIPYRSILQLSGSIIK